MRVCFVVSEFFAWGKYGGFGSMARMLGKALLQRGVHVSAVVPRRNGQGNREVIDGISTFSYPGQRVLSTDVYPLCDADIYHSFEATIATYAAMRAMPHRKHIITSIDPFDWNDWRMELRYDIQDSWSRSLVYPLMWGYYSSPWVRHAVRNAHKVYCQAKFIIPKVRKMYHLGNDPLFLPNPYPIPDGPIRKAKKPTVCFLGRWDPRKRPEIFFELARKFPDVHFLALGKAHNEARNQRLYEHYGEIPNLELVGFINPFESDRLRHVLRESWIMINTAAREGLPAAFIEAAAHKCAILSGLDPDGFASRGGYHAEDEDFVTGLNYLLEHNRWQELGERGYSYVRQVHDTDVVVTQHLNEYRSLLNSTSAGPS